MPKRSQTTICKHVGDLFREFGTLPGTYQKTSCSKPGAVLQVLRSKSVTSKFIQILHEKPPEQLESTCKHVGDVLREFEVNSRTYQNRPFSKPWATAQAFWSKSANFGGLKILAKSSIAMPYAVRNSFSSIWAMFWWSLRWIPELTKVDTVENHGL